MTSQEEALQEKIRELENGAEKVKSEKDAEIEKIKGEANMIIKARVSVILSRFEIGRMGHPPPPASRDLADSLHKALNQQNLNKDKEIQNLIDDSNKCVKQYLEDFAKEKEQLAAAEAEKLKEVNSQIDTLRNDVKEHQSKVKKAESDLGRVYIIFTHDTSTIVHFTLVHVHSYIVHYVHRALRTS